MNFPHTPWLALACCLLPALSARAALTDGVVGYYNFETSFEDQSGNGRHLTVGGGNPEFAWEGGSITRGSATADRSLLLVGKALNLVAADGDFLKMPFGSGASAVAAGSVDLNGTFSISSWQNLSPLVPEVAGARYYVFEADNNFDISWGTNGAAGDVFISYNSQTAGLSRAFDRGVWHHVVHVFKRTGDNLQLTVYVDGIVAGTPVTVAASNMDFSRINLGNARNGQGRRWDGLLDEITIWDRDLDAVEVNELYARGLGGFAFNQDLAGIGKAYVGAISSNPAGGATTGTGIYDLGSSATLSAQPALGYLFTGWSVPFEGQPAAFNPVVSGSFASFAGFSRDLNDDDNDGLTNYDELVVHNTFPGVADTDGDGIPDGDEIKLTGTSPLTSDSSIVNFVTAALCGAERGDILLATPQLVPNSSGDGFKIRFSVQGSTNGGAWTSIPLDAPGASVTRKGADLELVVPAPSAVVPLYRFNGRNP